MTCSKIIWHYAGSVKKMYLITYHQPLIVVAHICMMIYPWTRLHNITSHSVSFFTVSFVKALALYSST